MGEPRMEGRISVFLVAGNRLLREALARLLTKKGDFNLCDVSPSIDTFLTSVESSVADVLILDSATARVCDLAAVSDVMQKYPNTKVMLIDMEDDPELFLRCVRAGAVGFLLKDASAADVISGVRSVVQGLAVSPGHFGITLFHAISGQRPELRNIRIKVRFGLSWRQQQLIALIAQGLSNKQIASELNLSEQTVKNHVHRIFRKVGASDRLSVVEKVRQ
jgi:DNA-binding NarL/FixJ family response regulator